MRRDPESSASDPAAVAALADFSNRILRVDQGAEAILAAVERYPAEGVLHVAASFFWLFGQTAEAQDTAARHLAAARDDARLNRRERAWLRALDLWHRKSFDAAATAFEEITVAWPDDLLALRAAEFLYYVLGQQFSGERFAAHTARLAERHAEDPDFLAIHAFANELCGRTALAIRLAQRALALAPVNPWAQHAYAHALLWQGNGDEAAALLEGWLPQWREVARTVHCHNAWHAALTHLDRLETERAFEIFDEHVWGISPELVVEQLDAIAFLWRAEMAGVDVAPSRWQPILPHVRRVCETLFMPFATAHYAYALARGGDAAATASLLRVVARRAADTDAEARRVWAPVGADVVDAAAALGAGNAVAAAIAFDRAMPLMTSIGGSDAQDDLFRFAYLDSLQRAGRGADAARLLRERLQHKPASPLERQLLERM
jgi:tetratricopeptide (TPR) repeat protein